MSLAQLLNLATERFENALIESARVDAELIACHVLQVSRGQLQSDLVVGTVEFSPEQAQQFEYLVARRELREPLQHLTQKAAFRNLELRVGKGVFVPRPETEFVTDLAIDGIRGLGLEKPIVVDLCAGSGAIGLAIATELRAAKVYAVEKSPEAYAYAKLNYESIAPEATVVLADLDGAFSELDGSVDWVISNPPYIPAAMVPIYPEVALHDPSLALYGGEDGLDVIRLVSSNALRLLRAGGGLTIEHADSQGEQVRQLLLIDGWKNVQTHKDFNGRDRAATATR